MVFFDQNYWGQPKTNPNINTRTGPIGGVGAGGLFAALRGIDPSRGVIANKQIGITPEAAPQLKEEVNSKGSIFGLPAGLIETLLKIPGLNVGAGIGMGHLARMGLGDYQAPKAQPPAPTNPNDSVGDGMGGIFGGMLGIANTASKAAQGIAGRLNQPESIEDLIARLSGQIPQMQYEGPSGQERAKAQFAPQFQILQNMENQANTNYETRAPEVKSLYDSLVNATLQGRKQTEGEFDQAVADTNKNYGAASKNVTGNFTNSSKSLMAEMAKLGLNEGAGDLVAQSQDRMGAELGKLSQNQQTNADLFEGLGANAFAYDTRMSDVNRQQGVEAQNGLYNMLQERLGELGNQRLGLESQQGAAANNYDMQIQQMLAEGGQSRQQQIMDMAEFILNGQSTQARNSLDLERFGLERERLDLDKQRAAGSGQPDLAKMNPYQALQQRALSLYGGDANKARQAADIILQAYMENPGATNVAQLLEQLGPARNTPGYQDLAFDFFNRLLS